MTTPRDPDNKPVPGSEDLPENVPDGAVEPAPEAPPIVINTPSVTVHEDDDTEDKP